MKLTNLSRFASVHGRLWQQRSEVAQAAAPFGCTHHNYQHSSWIIEVHRSDVSKDCSVFFTGQPHILTVVGLPDMRRGSDTIRTACPCPAVRERRRERRLRRRKPSDLQGRFQTEDFTCLVVYFKFFLSLLNHVRLVRESAGALPDNRRELFLPFVSFFATLMQARITTDIP